MLVLIALVMWISPAMSQRHHRCAHRHLIDACDQRGELDDIIKNSRLGTHWRGSRPWSRLPNGSLA